MYMYTLHTHFCTFGANLYGQSVLINKIPASELSRKFVKSALLVGQANLTEAADAEPRGAGAPVVASPAGALGLGVAGPGSVSAAVEGAVGKVGNVQKDHRKIKLAKESN